MFLSAEAVSAEFSARLGSALRAVRRERRLRLRQLSTDSLPLATLKAIEKGTHSLTPMLVAEVAARYGMDLSQLFPTRAPLVLLATGTVCAGDAEEHFEPGDLDSLIAAYLRLVGDLRGTDGGVTTLRRHDLIDIADQVGRPRTDIVDRVALALGASDTQRRAMVELYLAGADVIGISA